MLILISWVDSKIQQSWFRHLPEHIFYTDEAANLPQAWSIQHDQSHRNPPMRMVVTNAGAVSAALFLSVLALKGMESAELRLLAMWSPRSHHSSRRGLLWNLWSFKLANWCQVVGSAWMRVWWCWNSLCKGPSCIVEEKKIRICFQKFSLHTGAWDLQNLSRSLTRHRTQSFILPPTCRCWSQTDLWSRPADRIK